MSDKLKRILLFDDDYESMLPLKWNIEMLLDWSVDLTAAETLATQLSKERYDLICVDLMIHPISLNAENEEVQNMHFDGINWQKTGLEFLRRLRQGEFTTENVLGTSPDVPVIVLSAVADESVRGELRGNINASEYVEKPFDLDQIITCMQKILSEQHYDHIGTGTEKRK